MRYVLVLSVALIAAYSRSETPLRLTATIAMPHVSGRIDHMAVDAAQGRLFVAALGNDTLEVLDLKTDRVVQSVAGLGEPQGIAYVAESGRLFVAAGRDGKCHVYSGVPLREVSVIDVGGDADNVRYDGGARRLYVAYGSGGLAVIDASDLRLLARILLFGHPESFQLEHAGARIYVNVPEAGNVTVVDRVQQKVIATWPLPSLRANFPMALNEAENQVLLATRKPAKLVVLDSRSGKKLQELDCAADADDLFYDAANRSVYVSCGAGVIDIFAQGGGLYRELARIPTRTGARTSIWVPELEELFVAAPAGGGQQAAVLVYGFK